MAEIPGNIKREHLVKALQKIDKEGVPANAHSSTYDVAYEGKKYPPKLVVSWANQYANGTELNRNLFAGGLKTECFALLEKEGFKIEKKQQSTRAFLLAWNPKHYSEGGDGDGEGVLSFKPGDEVRWSCQSKSPSISDIVYLVRLGIHPKGIIAKGVVTQELFKDKDFRDPSKEKTYIKFRVLEQRFDCKGGLLPQALLKKSMPDQQFSPQSSGIEIKDVYADTLNELWEEGGGKHSLKQFVDWINKDVFGETANWLAKYKRTTDLANDIKNKIKPIDNAALETLWLKDDNGIAHVAPGFLSKEDFINNIDSLKTLTRNIVDAPSKKTMNDVLVTWKALIDTKKVRQMYRSVINRVFSAAAPDLYTSIVGKDKCTKLLTVLEEQFQINIDSVDDWVDCNEAIKSALDSANCSSENSIKNNIAMWMLYEVSTKNTENNIDIGITKEQFIDALLSSDVRKDGDLEMLGLWLSMPNREVTATQLAAALSYANAGAINFKLGGLGKRIAEHVGLTLHDREGDSPGWWKILAFGEQASTGFIWKMKNELAEALMEINSYYPELEKFIAQANQGGLTTSNYKDQFSFLRVKVSFGQGVQAKIPWIGFYRDGQTTMLGIYPGYLYYRSLNCLILAKCRSETKKPPIDWPDKDLITIESYLNKEYGQSPERYGDSYVYKAYDLSNPLNKDEINKDLNSLIDEYKKIALSDVEIPVSVISKTSLPKPFLLLAGISGSGKSRFIRKEAELTAVNVETPENYCLVPVRPDWHEPSDLLGYVSRIGGKGAEYVVTDVLKFMVKAWIAAMQSATKDEIKLKDISSIQPYWLCLDEMNLAPVEQYFADYLSVIETRKWEDGKYKCDPILKLDALQGQLGKEGMVVLRNKLSMDGAEYDGLWANFSHKGISLPPNLIVAGTVNMDETTHGFSRKVIDRALTIDFGEFFPNDYQQFFDQPTRAKGFTFPVLSQATENDLAVVTIDKDADGFSKSIAFLEQVNNVLRRTPFELAYRALNELLLSVICFAPKNDRELQAVWDDFLMMKVLPRIDGDSDKLRAKTDKTSADNVLVSIEQILEKQLKDIWTDKRPDLLRENNDGSPLVMDVLSKKKLEWMKARLDANGFTAFWP